MSGEESEKEMSVGAEVWRKAMDRPYVVRATVNRVRNEIVDSFDDWTEARAIADGYADARIFHAVSGQDVSESPPEVTEIFKARK